MVAIADEALIPLCAVVYFVESNPRSIDLGSMLTPGDGIERDRVGWEASHPREMEMPGGQSSGSTDVFSPCVQFALLDLKLDLQELQQKAHYSVRPSFLIVLS